MTHEVFISYSSKDKAKGDAVCAALEANGLRCWIAPRNIEPGRDWTEAIMDGIQAAKVMVLVFSRHSNDSIQVKQEVSCAIESELTVVPLRLEDVPMNKSLKFRLADTHWLDATTPPFEERLKELSQTLMRLVGISGQSVNAAPPLMQHGIDNVERAPRQPPLQQVEAGHRKIVFNTIGMGLVRIEAGTFMMGSASTEAGRSADETLHQVRITKPFMSATTPVTQAQWKSVMENNPSRFQAEGRPVEQISWKDATEFCEKLGAKEGTRYRLPTEAEWEYACRSGTQTPFGGTNNLDEIAWYFGNSNGQTHPVAQKEPNAWGLYDMHGNVWEWCGDLYGPCRGDATDPTGSLTGDENSSRVLRGGSWGNDPRYCRAAFRNRSAPDARSSNIGLRVCLDF